MKHHSSLAPAGEQKITFQEMDLRSLSSSAGSENCQAMKYRMRRLREADGSKRSAAALTTLGLRCEKCW
jgi:hypothetical protein